MHQAGEAGENHTEVEAARRCEMLAIGLADRVGIPAILEVYRMSGRIDYMLRIVVPDIESYDHVYRRLIGPSSFYDANSTFAMEVLKSATVLPINYA